MAPKRKEVDESTYEGRFAARLRMLRGKAGLTVEELAERLDVKPITVYGWESGKRSPHIANLPAIAEVFNFKRTRDVLPEK